MSDGPSRYGALTAGIEVLLEGGDRISVQFDPPAFLDDAQRIATAIRTEMTTWTAPLTRPAPEPTPVAVLTVPADISDETLARIRAGRSSGGVDVEVRRCEA